MKKIAIVGLGLMGGSFAKAFIEYSDNIVYGYDINEKTIKDARNLGIKIIDNKNEFKNMDLTIICLNPSSIKKFVEENCKYLSNTVMEISGVKNNLYPYIKDLSKKYSFTYKSIHPMAGREVYGFESSLKDLYTDASMIYLDDLDDEEIFLFKKIGFNKFVKASPKKHDQMISFTSQLCHVISNAYVLNEKSLNHDGFSAGSLKDMTRVSKIDENLWSELFLLNKEFLIEDIDVMIKNLKYLKSELKNDDLERLKAQLKRGNDIRKKMW